MAVISFPLRNSFHGSIAGIKYAARQDRSRVYCPAGGSRLRHVFISYCREDFDFAKNLQDHVKSSGFATWKDFNLNAGVDWRAEIDDAIRDALAVIVVLSPSALQSDYVNYEWAFALGAGIPVVPVLLRLPASDLPPRLSIFQHRDFTNPLSRPWEALMKDLADRADAQRPFTVHVPRNAPPVVREAAAALDSTDARQRKAAIESLAQMNHPAVVEVLADAARHPLQDVRIPAAIDLADHADVRALPALLEAIRIRGQRGVHWDVHGYTLSKLGLAAVPALIEALADADINVRGAVIAALGQIGGSCALLALDQCLQDSDSRVRSAAIESLGEMEDRSTLPSLVRLIRDPAADVRQKVASAFRKCGDPSTTPHLIELLQDEDRDVRHTAAWALEQIGSRDAVPALIRALNDEYSQTGLLAAKALQRIGDRAAIPGLLQAAGNEDSQIRSYIEEALKSFGGAALPEVRESLRSENPRVRSMAVRVLVSSGDESDIPQLLVLARDAKASVRWWAVRALSRYPTPEVVQAIIERLQDDDEDVCKEAAEKLGAIGDPASIPPLIDCLQDEFVAEEAAAALERIGTRSARTAVRTWKKAQQASGE